MGISDNRYNKRLLLKYFTEPPSNVKLTERKVSLFGVKLYVVKNGDLLKTEISCVRKEVSQVQRRP